MLNDGDLWPISCPRCQKTTKYTISHLKQWREFKCTKCGEEYTFANAAFAHQITNLRTNVSMEQNNASQYLARKRRP